MKMKTQTTLFKRLTAGALSAVLALGAFAAVPMIPDSPVMMTVQAATTADGQFEYSLDDGEVTITRYKGNGGAVTIPSTIDGKPVTSIGEYAFYNCTSLTSVTIPNSVTSIGDLVFSDCTSLTSVTIPNGVTSIGELAFSSCTSLTSVTIPASVTSIGDCAFSSCTSLTSVTIPASVTSIGELAFSSCTSLTSIQVSSSNKNYSSQNGVLFNKQKTELITCPGGKSGAYTIPDSVTTVDWYAFEYCTSLTSVTIPNSVTSIGEYAFSDCTSLSSVTIPNSVTSIGEYAFYSCTSLTSVTIPNSVTSIGRGAFYYCTSLTSVTIPNSVTSIGDWAFYYCKSLTSVTIPNSVTSIGGGAFYGCEGLTSVTIPNSVTSIGACAFSNCTSLTSVTIPNSVTSIGEYAFKYCTSLTSVTIPNSVTSIGEYAFYNCTSLTSVTISDGVTSIGEAAFSDCSGLTSVTIPNSVTSIGSYAFSNCPNLTIVGNPGNYAETYAEENNIPFAPYGSFLNTSTLSKTTVPKLTVVTVKGDSIGGTGSVTYAFYYKKSTSKTWTSMGEKFGSTKEVSFIPSMAATYQVMVKAKDETGKVVTKMMELTATNPTANDLVNKSTISKTEVKKGEAIALTGKATGGEGSYTYAFYYKKAASKAFTPVAEPYSGKTKVYFKPAYAAEYTVRILVKDEAGTVAVKQYKVNVTA